MFELYFTIENGRILSLVFLFVSYVPMIFGGKGTSRLVDFSWIDKNGEKLSTLILLLYILILIAPVFLEITHIIMLLVLGYAFFICGCIGICISYLNYFTTPLGQLIRKGMYQISRNPIYVFSLAALIGIAILCESILLSVFIVIYFIIQHHIIKKEERFCEDNFGEEYIQYKNKTRRYL